MTEEPREGLERNEEYRSMCIVCIPRNKERALGALTPNFPPQSHSLGALPARWSCGLVLTLWLL